MRRVNIADPELAWDEADPDGFRAGMFRLGPLVGAFVIAAVVTPPDVLSQFMLAVPMCILYEAGLFLARFVGTRKEEVKEESPAA